MPRKRPIRNASSTAQAIRSVSLDEGASVQAGNVSLRATRQRIGNPGQATMLKRGPEVRGETIGFTHREPLDDLQELSLLDEKGRVIGRPVGQTSRPDYSASPDAEDRYPPLSMTTFVLRETPSTVTLRAKDWTTVEKREVPFDLRCGIGLAAP